MKRLVWVIVFTVAAALPAVGFPVAHTVAASGTPGFSAGGWEATGACKKNSDGKCKDSKGKKGKTGKHRKSPETGPHSPARAPR